MEVIEFGIIVFLQPAIKVFVLVSIMALELSRESKVVFSLFMTILFNLEQRINASLPIEFTELPMATEVSLEQSKNALSPIAVTEFGMAIEVNPEQYINACSPISVTEFGMVTEVNPSQSKNASSPIAVTEFGIIVFLQPAIKVFDAVSIMALQLSRES